MSLPNTNFDPGFHITRASHVVLTVRDLAASRQFYSEVIGLILTAEEGDTLYFRGVEEACHHSLVLRKAKDVSCMRIGLRVFTDADLDRLKAFFETQGCPAAWADVPHQGRTLHATDPAGTPLEFCATMPVVPRMITKFTRHAGGSALRLDHYQILTPDVRRTCEFYMAAGFRLSEYVAPSGTFDLRGVFLQRKGNPHDIVFFNGTGPGLHHFASWRRRCIICCMPAMSRVNSASGAASSAVRGVTDRVMRCMSICATRTAIASSCSTPTTRSWISRTSRLAGTRPILLSPTPGDCRHARPGSRKQRRSRALPPASRRSNQVR
jgi:catechol 2,3-dioxygenase-like lactoylglutathione lyase family enzyme